MKSKDTEKAVETKVVEEKAVETKATKVKETKTFGTILSRANYTVEIKCNGKKLYIPPFGKARVMKEKLNIDSNDAKYLTFIKD